MTTSARMQEKARLERFSAALQRLRNAARAYAADANAETEEELEAAAENFGVMRSRAKVAQRTPQTQPKGMTPILRGWLAAYRRCQKKVGKGMPISYRMLANENGGMSIAAAKHAMERLVELGEIAFD